MSEQRRGLRHVEQAMGTVFSFDIRDTPTAAIASALRAAVAWLHHVDEVFSPYRPGSAVSRLARAEISRADCSPEVREVLDLCARVRRATDGWFSHTPDGTLDPSGLVKGWAVERAWRILDTAGARNACVNGGGDLQLGGESAPGVPWRIGIAHPLRPGTLCTVVTGRDLAIATSGTAERGAHILDPHTGAPADGPASVTVVGRRLTLTDAYATAAFAMGGRAAEWLEHLDGYEGFAVLRDGRSWRTTGFPDTERRPSPGGRTAGPLARRTRTVEGGSPSGTRHAPRPARHEDSVRRDGRRR